MNISKQEIYLKGKPIKVDTIRVDDVDIIIVGKLIKIARVKEEWYEDIENPTALIKRLKNAEEKADIFTFWQRPPDTTPKYNYYMEREAISALHVESFDHWWKKQIRSPTRNKIRKAEKKDVIVKQVDFNDKFIKGIINIFNEAPIRRGKPFWHYGKNFDTVKKEWSRDIDRSDFIGAYYKGQLIGFIKLVYGVKLAQQVQNISMIEHQNKYTTNALIAKAVEICDNKKIPFLTYGAWRRGSHADFLRRHGFEKIILPRYYIPFTIKGKIILKMKLHRGFFGIFPENLISYLLNLRAKWYKSKYVTL